MPTCAIHKIQDALAIAYTYESNRIEGNTLTLQETALIVNEGVIVSGKSMREHLEAINHAQAVYFINDMAKREIAISQTIIKNSSFPYPSDSLYGRFEISIMLIYNLINTDIKKLIGHATLWLSF